MAIFKLGAFVTAIVGSVGGTNFKRGTNNAIVTNKSFGGSRNKLLQNAQLNPIAQIFKLWSGLSPALKTLWAEKALLFTFPDKFGVEKNLTARQLFSKLNIQLLPVPSYYDDPTGMSSFLYSFTVPNSTVKTNQTEATVTINTTTGINNYLISAEIKQGEILSPTFSKRKVIFVSQAEGIETLDLIDEFFSNFPEFGVGYTAVFYVTAINSFGFKSVPVASFADIDPD